MDRAAPFQMDDMVATLNRVSDGLWNGASGKYLTNGWQRGGQGASVQNDDFELVGEKIPDHCLANRSGAGGYKNTSHGASLHNLGVKIVAVGRNYAEHARELGNEIPEEPVLFMKPESALVWDNHPFLYPKFSQDVHFEAEIVLRICSQAKNVSREEAKHTYDALTVGIDFTARDLQSKCKAKGLPWEISKAFDGSAPIGKFIPVPEREPIEFSLTQNGEARQRGSTADMLHGFDALIHHITRFFTLEPGDLIFTGTPSGVGPVQPGDLLEAFIGDQKLLACVIA